MASDWLSIEHVIALGFIIHVELLSHRVMAPHAGGDDTAIYIGMAKRLDRARAERWAGERLLCGHQHLADNRFPAEFKPCRFCKGSHIPFHSSVLFYL